MRRSEKEHKHDHVSLAIEDFIFGHVASAALGDSEAACMRLFTRFLVLFQGAEVAESKGLACVSF